MAVFLYPTLVTLRGWGEESIFSNEDESQSPAMQGWRVGTILLKPQPVMVTDHQPTVQMGAECVLGAGHQEIEIEIAQY